MASRDAIGGKGASGKASRTWRYLSSGLLLAGALTVALMSGRDFAAMHVRDPIVPGPGVTSQGRLSDYLPALQATPGDSGVYFLEGEEPGPTVLALGGVHPNEIAGVLAAIVFVENARVEQGRLIVVPRSNESAFTHSSPGQAAPRYVSIETPWGVRDFRYGDRLTNPLHQYPDPEVHVHYPTGSLGSGSEARNLNRNFPGRPEGTFTERIGYSITELIRQEEVQLVLDMHEARPMNPIVNAIAVHERAADIGALAVLDLELLDGVRMRLEHSPEGFRGVSQRELGDHTDSYAVLSETPNVAMDFIRGPTNEELVLSGRDEFMHLASQHRGLVYVNYDHETGLPIRDRVGRHVSAFLALVDALNELHAGEPVVIVDVPRYRELMENGIGHYLRNPDGELGAQ